MRVHEFAAIVRSDPDVRAGFAAPRLLVGWWRAILALHGPPVTISLGADERIAVIARGFELYAWLYRGLALVFLLLALAAALARARIDPGIAELALAGGLLAGLYLWLVSGLLFRGADAYRSSPANGARILACGLVLVIAFLCMFFVGAAALAHSFDLVPLALDLVLLVSAVALGVGSYGLELAYLLAVLARDA